MLWLGRDIPFFANAWCQPLVVRNDIVYSQEMLTSDATTTEKPGNTLVSVVCERSTKRNACDAVNLNTYESRIAIVRDVLFALKSLGSFEV
jgi:hypothetical protein